MDDIKTHIPFAEKACEYLSASPDPYHAVKNSVEKLEQCGFLQLRKREPFVGKVQTGGKYYYTLNRSTLVAFAVGPKHQPGNPFKVVGGHTDSPNLKVKPRSKRSPGSSSGCVQLNVECYGGGLWHTWFDRDLGISGRVFVRSNKEGTETITQRLVKIDRPIARVSTLAIHLQSSDEMASFKVNKEDHLSPIVGMVQSPSQSASTLQNSITHQLTGAKPMAEDKQNDDEDPWASSQEPALLRLLAEHLNVDVKSIADFELNLFDTQAASLGGVESEFLYSARLDNLATCFVATEALISHCESDDFVEDADVSLMVLFDHEEVGSASTHGAGSPVMFEALNRISASLNGHDGANLPDMHAMTVRKSFVLSIDQAHAVHPNYSAKHERYHAPKMNSGVVLKTNQNQRYASNGVTSFLVREVCRRAQILPPQDFAVRNDCRCGSTIGPIISCKTGLRTVDLGMPQLSMHSCREVMGIADLTHGFEFIKAFFKHFSDIDEHMEG